MRVLPFFITIATLFNIQTLVYSQSFTMKLTPNEKVLMQGESAEFAIEIAADNYSSSIYLEVLTNCYQSSFSFNPTILNVPYTNGKLTIKPQNMLPGIYSFVIHGYNGPLHRYDTINIEIKPSTNSSWVIYNKDNSGIRHDFFKSISINSHGHIFLGGVSTPVQRGATNLIAFNKDSWYSWEKDSILVYDNCNLVVEKKKSLHSFSDNSFLYTDKSDNTYVLSEKQIYLINADNSTSLILDLSAQFISPSVTRFIKDKQGRFWISTLEGLFMVQENLVTRFDVLNSGLASNRVEDLTEDPKGRIWVVTDPASVVMFDGIFWTTYTSANSNFNIYYSKTIAADSIGNIYVGGGIDQGIDKFDGVKWEKLSIVSNFIGLIECIKFDKKGNLFAGAYTGSGLAGLFQFDGKTWKFFNGNNSDFTASNYDYAYGKNSVMDLAIDPVKGVWLATNGEGLVYFDGESDLITSNSNTQNYSEIINVFPNPSNGKITIQVPSKNQIKKVSIMDITGNIILEETGNDEDSLSIGNLKPGFYFLKIESSIGITTQKVVVR